MNPSIETEYSGKVYKLGLVQSPSGRDCASLEIDGTDVYFCGPYRQGPGAATDDARTIHDLASFLAHWVETALSDGQYCDTEERDEKRADFDCDDDTLREIESACDWISLEVMGVYGEEV